MLPPSTPTRPALRQLLRTILPTDSDFAAFCSDYFPAIADHFSNGMDRVAKATLLLDTADPTAVATALQQHDPKLFAQHRRHPSAADPAGQNPYRGLAAFQLEEAHLFFGRDALIGTLWQRFEAQHAKPALPRLLPILGPSGSGKSSVARAGLLAALVQSPIPGPQPLRLAILKPGERPIESLARALVPLLPPDTTLLPAQRADAIEKLLREPAFPDQGLRRFAASLPDREARPLVVLVDQFEELYTLSGSAADRDLLVGLLLHAAQSQPAEVAVVLTLRSDFLGETQRYHNLLGRLIAEQAVIVPPLSPDELRAAITRPAEQAGRPIDEATIELLLSEARGSQGALPLLEFALTRIWEGTQRGEEPGATLRQLGGVGGALAGEAQKIYHSLSGPEQATARRALVRLVRLGEGTRDTRRRAPVGELCGRGETEAAVLTVLRKFATKDARLVTLSGEGPDAIAEVTHEALFDHWTELRTWIAESRRDRGLFDRALEAAKLWTAAGRPPGRLWRPPDLDLLRDYQQRKPDEPNLLQADFLTAGIRQQRQEKLLRLGAVLAVFVAILNAAGIYIANERQRTREARERLLDNYVDRGQELLFKDGETDAGLLWLHRAKVEGSTNPILPYLLKSGMQGVDTDTLVLTGHRSTVISAEFSPDGRRIVTASEDRTARVWNADGGWLMAELKGHGASVRSAEFSPDSRRVVTASYDRTARVWDADSGRLMFELQGHKENVESAGFSPDGHRIVTASADHTARVWDADSGRVMFELQGHTSSVLSAAFSPDGHRIVTASADHTARVWDADSGRLVAALTGHAKRVLSAAFSPDSHRIVTASADLTARVWDADSGQLVVELKGHASCVRSALFSPDGSHVVTTSDDHAAVVWDVNQGWAKIELKGTEGPVWSARFSPDSRYLVTASEDHTARVWDANQGRLVVELKGHNDRIRTATFSPDGRRVVTASDDQTSRVWQAVIGNFLVELKEPGTAIGIAEFSPDSHRIVTTSENHPAQVWETDSGRLVAELKGQGAQVSSAEFSPDSRRIVTVSDDRKTRVWDASNGKLLVELGSPEAIVLSANFSPDGRRIITVSDDQTARVWDADSGKPTLELKGFKEGHFSAKFSPDNHRIVTAGSVQPTRVWNADSGRVVFDLNGNAEGVYRATFSPDGRRIVTEGLNGTVQTWDANSGSLVAELQSHAESLDITFSPDGCRVVTAGWDRLPRVWDADRGILVAELKSYGTRVLSAKFSHDGRLIVTANLDAIARVWDANSGRLVAELKGRGAHCRNAKFSPDGRRIVTSDSYHATRVWDASPETRSSEQLAKLIHCRVSARFEHEGSTVIIPTTPDPAACQAEVQP